MPQVYLSLPRPEPIFQTGSQLDFIHFQEVKEQGKLALLYREKREAYTAHGLS